MCIGTDDRYARESYVLTGGHRLAESACYLTLLAVIVAPDGRTELSTCRGSFISQRRWSEGLREAKQDGPLAVVAGHATLPPDPSPVLRPLAYILCARPLDSAWHRQA